MLSNVFIFNCCVFAAILLILYFNKLLYGSILNDFFNPSFSFILFLLIFFVNLNTKENDFGVLTGILVFTGSIAWMLGFYLNGFKFIRIHKWMPSFELKGISTSHYILYQLIFVALCFGLTIFKLRTFGYSLQDYLLNMLLVENENVKEGGNFWTLFYHFIKFPMMVNHFRLLKNTKNVYLKVFLICFTEVLFSLAALSSSRLGYIMAFVFAYFMYCRARGKRPTVNYFTVSLLILAFPVLNMLNRLRNGDIEWLTNFHISDLWDLGERTLSADANPGQNFDILVKYLSNTHDYHWGFFFISQFFFLIPRFLWPGKPITSFEFEYTIRVMHEHPIQDGTTYTFTAFDAYAGFGIPSLIIIMLLFGIITRYFYEMFYKRDVNCLIIIYGTTIILYYINLLRASVVDLSAYYFLDFALILAFYILYRKLNIFYAPGKNTTPVPV